MNNTTNINRLIERIKNWKNGVTVFGIVSVSSLGSVGTSSCLGGNCGSACGFKCLIISTLALVLACLKCKKKK